MEEWNLTNRVAKALDDLPKLDASPAPWSLARSRISVNLPDGRKVRQEGAGWDDRKRANCRLIAAAGSWANLEEEALLALCHLLEHGAPRSPPVDQVLAMIAQGIAWVRNAPDRGRALFDALGLEVDTRGWPTVLRGDQLAAWNGDTATPHENRHTP